MRTKEKKSKIEKKLFWSDLLAPFVAWIRLVLLTAAAIATLLLIWVIIRNAGTLGTMFLPALIGYFATLISLAGWLYRRKELREILGVVGPEEFYRAFPHERRRMERRLRWQEKLDAWQDWLDDRQKKLEQKKGKKS